MKLRILALSCLCLLAVGRPVFAQTEVRAGAHVGLGCQQGRDDCVGVMGGPVVSVSLADRVVVRARGLWFTVSDRTVVNQHVAINESEVGRRMLLGEFIYRFGPGTRVRPLIGLSVGARTDSASVHCTPGPCSMAFGAPSASQFPDGSPKTHASWGIVGGFGFDLTDVVGLEASVGLHDWLRDQGRTAEAAVYATFQLWRSK